jgi:hypothetical protein
MQVQRPLIFAIFATCWAGMALAQELAAVANPEELSFSTDRLKRITETYQGYVESGELPGSRAAKRCNASPASA